MAPPMREKHEERRAAEIGRLISASRWRLKEAARLSFIPTQVREAAASRWDEISTNGWTAPVTTRRIARLPMFPIAFSVRLGLLLLLWAACAGMDARPVEALREAAAAFHADKLAEIDSLIALAIQDGRCPGGVLWIERQGAVYRKAFGERALEPQREPMTEETIFDAASLTKVTATTSAIMKLVEQRKIELDGPVSRYLPEFCGAGKESITVRQLLTHTSGLRAGLP
ncbi:MAG: beta-lactamase family protein, partial [Verrucomicrobiota bacterium]|nr:beta-lactamase family protein [Verrucomicrobiota bacterium]